jgi:hypothetical protein
MLPLLQSRRTLERYLEVLLADHPVAIWPLGEVNGTVARDVGPNGLNGTYSGGTTYYNTVTVSGTLNPDVTGIYTAAGMYNGKPYYTNGTYFIWNYSVNSKYYIAPTAPGGALNQPGTWYGPASLLIDGTYSSATGGTSTGTATVANDTNSGTYLFIPGYTLGNAGPVVNGTALGAAGFNGVNGLVNMGNILDQPTNDFSLEIWFKTTSVATGSNNALIMKRTTGTGNDAGYQFCAPNGTVRFHIADGATNTNLIRGSGLNDNAWHHAVGVAIRGTSLSLFIDGAQSGDSMASAFTTDISSAASINLALGALRTANTYHPFSGSLALASIYPTALPAERVRLHYLAAVQGV